MYMIRPSHKIQILGRVELSQNTLQCGFCSESESSSHGCKFTGVGMSNSRAPSLGHPCTFWLRV